jgi:hypothetical protein
MITGRTACWLDIRSANNYRQMRFITAEQIMYFKMHFFLAIIHVVLYCKLEIKGRNYAYL